jgi:hypothetical protein
MLCLQKDYIDQVPVILSGHLQRESKKSCGPVSVGKYWRLHRSVCGNTLINTHTTTDFL